MSSVSETHEQHDSDRTLMYALQALPSSEIAAAEAHIAACSDCLHEVESLRSVVASFADWPTDVLRPAVPLWERLARRVAAEIGEEPLLLVPERWSEPEWEKVAPGITCKLLAHDTQTDRMTMLVRLDPGIDYPPHRHAGLEELHLLHGELFINDRRLLPGDYNRAEAGSTDQRVWSKTGCTCLLITSSLDELR